MIYRINFALLQFGPSPVEMMDTVVSLTNAQVGCYDYSFLVNSYKLVQNRCH